MQTLEEFYKQKFDWVPETLKNEIGHFNLFRHEPILPNKVKILPYKRRDFYKIMFVKGNIKMNYADKIITIKKQALFFSNPQIPYNCENLEEIEEGSYCIFNANFFHKYGNLNDYSVFKSEGNHVFELSDDQAAQVKQIFEKMFVEINSEYIHKYDVLRNQVFDLLHFALKIQPATNQPNRLLNASQRIATLFLELLERQFPLDENHPNLTIRAASDYASLLNVHVNHLNKAVKEITHKSTTQIIAERLLREAKVLLKESKWNISEIAYALGFKEVTHFNNFFKKHTGGNPMKFRNS